MRCISNQGVPSSCNSVTRAWRLSRILGGGRPFFRNCSKLRPCFSSSARSSGLAVDGFPEFTDRDYHLFPIHVKLN